MHTPSGPQADLADLPHNDETRQQWREAAPRVQAVEPLPSRTSPGEPESRAHWRADLRPAGTLLRHTVAVGALVAGLLEYVGWQVAQRAGDAMTVVPLAEWALGMARNLGGAVGVGVAVAGVALLVPGFRKRPLRAASAAFAFGVAGFLAFLSFLVSLAF